MTHVRSVDSTSLTRSTWPMPLPYPEVFRGGAAAKISMAHVKRLVSLQIALLDWFTLGRPSSCPNAFRLGRRLTARQWSVVRRFEDLVLDGNTPQFIAAADMGRSAAKNKDYEDSLAALCRAASMVHVFDYGGTKCSHPRRFDDSWMRCGRFVGHLGRAVPCNAKPVVASRLTAPDEPRFDPLDHFDECTRLRYEFPLTCGLSPEDVGSPPRCLIHATPVERLQLLRKLQQAGMLKLIAKDSFPKGFENGMFAVHKDSGRDRLVLDSRASNMLDPGQSVWCKAMASSSILGQIWLRDHEVLLASGEDLKDYFYQFKVNGERTCRNVLNVKLSASDAGYVFGGAFSDSGAPYFVGLSTLAMGDVCAVEYAQCSHVSLCIKNQVFSADELITLRGSLPRGLLKAGIIVDDLVILEQVARETFQHLTPGTSQASKRTSRARLAYTSAQLPHNPKKGFVDQCYSRFWGIEIDGVKGILRGSSLRLWPTCVITLRVCSLGLATIGLLEALAGSWVALLGVRRRLFSVMDVVFECLGVEDQKAVVRLSSELKAELISMVLLGPLALVNLRARPANFVVATDASMDTLAAVRAPCSSKVVEEMLRYCLRKGAWSKLLPPHLAWLRQHDLLDQSDELPDSEFVCNPLWETFARCLVYSTSWIKQVSSARHINILEMQAFVKEEKRLCEKHFALRVPCGVDSQVCLGALVKGRASSSSINNLLRQCMSYPLGADLYESYMYYPSQHNRADGPTRNASPKAPDMEVPSWFDDLDRDDTGSFDRWMMMHCPHLVKPEVPIQDIAGLDGVDLRPNSRCRRSMKQDHPVSESQEACDSKAPAVVAVDGGAAANPSSQETIHPCRSFPSTTKSLLCKEAVALLESIPASQFFLSESDNGFDSPGALDLFSGKCGVARQMIRLGAPWVLTYDIERGPCQDLLDERTRSVIRRLIQLKAFATFGAAPVCSSFSVAVTPPVRSSRFPRGIPGVRQSMRAKIQAGNSRNDFLADLLPDIIDVGMWYWIENPDTSWWWRQRRWRRYRDSRSPLLFRCCFCRFGTPWKKATRFATNTSLAGRRMWCSCSGAHINLRGTHPTRKIPWTLVAQPYPRGLCRLL